MDYIIVILIVLGIELAGVAALTGVLYLYWEILSKKEKHKIC